MNYAQCDSYFDDEFRYSSRVDNFVILLVATSLLVLFVGMSLGCFLERLISTYYQRRRPSDRGQLPKIKTASKRSAPSFDSLQNSYELGREDVAGKGSSDETNCVKPRGITNCKIANNSRRARHVAVIMDGNRRYGKSLPTGDPLEGHRSGGRTLVDCVQWCMDSEVEVLTVYAFSTENWAREPLEVSTLMNIFAQYAESFKTEALARNVRVKVLSTDVERLPENVQKAIDKLEQATAHCADFLVNICLSYGGRGDIVRAAQRVSEQVFDGKLQPSQITESLISSHLSTAHCSCGGANYRGDPDILIRTSGEHRLSNFLLWELAYTELFFIDKLWPQLTREDFEGILQQYASRSRRFGC